MMDANEDKARSKTVDEKFCSECGEIIRVKAEICPKCGVRQAPEISSGGKSKLTAALLALFLGGFGIHRFYLGKIGTGIIYLLFCWTFIPAVIAFIEAIILFSMSEQTFQKSLAGGHQTGKLSLF